MDRLNPQQVKAARLGFLGILLIVVGAKFMGSGYWQDYAPLELGGQPAILFFTLEDSCECMQELVEKAELQVMNWPAQDRQGVPIIRIGFEARKGLASQYQVYRVPCLILLDSDGKIVHRQEFAIHTQEPFNFAEFEAILQR